MVFDAVRRATKHIKFDCDKCERPCIDLNEISMQESSSEPISDYKVCNSCLEHMRSNIEDHFWYDVISEDDFERILSYLDSLDEIECVYDDNYTAGDISVHTNYATSDIVKDACDHFGYTIHSFGVLHEDDSKNNPDCLEDHGECFMIFLVPDGDVKPIDDPIEERTYSELDYLDESDKVFD